MFDPDKSAQADLGGSWSDPEHTAKLVAAVAAWEKQQAQLAYEDRLRRRLGYPDPGDDGRRVVAPDRPGFNPDKRTAAEGEWMLQRLKAGRRMPPWGKPGGYLQGRDPINTYRVSSTRSRELPVWVPAGGLIDDAFDRFGDELSFIAAMSAGHGWRRSRWSQPARRTGLGNGQL
jgi:hypothetical protein